MLVPVVLVTLPLLAVSALVDRVEAGVGGPWPLLIHHIRVDPGLVIFALVNVLLDRPLLAVLVGFDDDLYVFPAIFIFLISIIVKHVLVGERGVVLVACFLLS